VSPQGGPAFRPIQGKSVYSLWMLVKSSQTQVGTALALSGLQITVDR
jgi:hypothetical protein